MREKWRFVAAVAVVACMMLVAAGFYMLGRAVAGVGGAVERIVSRDTLRVRDTVMVREPQISHVENRGARRVLLPLADVDSMICEGSDSVFVSLPVERKVYEGADYKAWISGADARLDSIAVYPLTTRVSVSESISSQAHAVEAGSGVRRRRWRLHAGVGMSVCGSAVAPGVYGGISFEL